MGDLIFVLATVAFFAICVVYVNWCDRIIGPDEFGAETVEDPGAEPASARDTEMAA
jgi:hypothetical protein